VPPKPPVVVPKPVPPPEPAKPEITGVRGFVAGMPAGLKAGLPDAYWVYFDDQGWHLRTTTDNPAVRKFGGQIFLAEGAMADVRAYRVEAQDRLKKTSAQLIDFGFETIGEMDGVDFKFTGSKCVQFKLLIDGKPKPTQIWLGANKVHPPGSDFAICL